MFLSVVITLLILLLGLAYKAIRPPPPKICGKPNGPPITSPRIQLKDGRHLAYRESGTPKEKARYKIILVHAFDNSKEFNLPASQDLIDELGVYFLSFDRAGYGESDPSPNRTVKSEAMDIQELADQLEIGSKFYLIGVSMGGYPLWSCLKYIPNRLAGVAFVVPAINYWWSCFPPKLAKQVYSKLLVRDQVAFWIIHHAPFLAYWWLTQSWFPTLAAVTGHPAILSTQDKEIVEITAQIQQSIRNKARQQGVYESLHKDLIIAFGNWDFNPTEVKNPFPNNEGSVHIWQGYEDKLVPVELQRYIAEKLPWIKYHENPEGGHMFLYADGWADEILKELILEKGQTAN